MRPIGDRLVIATHNPGKLREITALIEPLGISCVGAEELDLPEPDEIGNTFADNADLKAREAADLSGLPPRRRS
jgi:XTP/dITP diphosphohydrolase